MAADARSTNHAATVSARSPAIRTSPGSVSSIVGQRCGPERVEMDGIDIGLLQDAADQFGGAGVGRGKAALQAGTALHLQGSRDDLLLAGQPHPRRASVGA